MKKSKFKWWGFIKDPVFGYIHFTEIEKNIIDTKSFQRLGRIRQLAGAEYVYPAANHTRFEHSLGVMYLAGELAKNLTEEAPEEDVYCLRLAGLLHDIGHGPFSHVFETLLNKKFGLNHEDMTENIIRNSNLTDVIKESGFKPSKIEKLAVGKMKADGKEYLNQVLRGTVDVDKMDYIVRDSYHSGAGYSADVWRLIYTMNIHEGKLCVNSTATHTLEAFLIARVESFKSIYFHKTARAAQIMLGQAMIKAFEQEPYLDPKNINEYLELDDYTLWCLLKKNPASKGIISDLEHRRLLKSVYENVVLTEEEVISNIFAKENVREKIEEEIANKAGVPVEEVIIDVPLVPSVPYSYTASEEKFEVPIFNKKEGKLETEPITGVSKIINALKGYLNIVRVYTTSKSRRKVEKAAFKILGSKPYEFKLAA